MHPWTLCAQPIDSVSSLTDAEQVHTSSDISTIAVPEGCNDDSSIVAVEGEEDETKGTGQMQEMKKVRKSTVVI